jgi:hypothetical protein
MLSSQTSPKRSTRRLLYKLKCSGIHGSLPKWLESYLSNRKQIVKVNGFASLVFFVVWFNSDSNEGGRNYHINNRNNLGQNFKKAKIKAEKQIFR